jgi:RHS repeat-associated protein
MTSGGSAGSSGRVTKGNEPGPHAITSTASGLVYDYDDNGNMIRHATGDVYEWDFKDRLINTTTATTSADYIYDYSGQRVIKKSQTGGTSRVDYYLGEGFELRDGKPVKFVFAGGQRIARLEGRLAETGQATTQQLNFKPGWNFFSLQLEPTDTAIATVLAPLDGNYTEVWAFDSVTQQYQGFIASDGANALTDITAQRGYIIYVANGATLNVSGIRQTDPINLQPGLNLIPSPADALVDVQEAFTTLANNYTGVWDYQTAPKTWRAHLPNQPAFLSELASLQPDKAYWLDVPNAAQILFQEQQKKILFYHADHLGSTNVVTDLAGDVVESTEFYPFGRTRHEHKNGFAADYQYTGKELDKETGLMYFEARYMDAVTGRFVSVDPLAVAPPELMLRNPQVIHAYSYAGNNPIGNRDPDGLFIDNVVGALVCGALSCAKKAIQIQDLKTNNRPEYERLYPDKKAVARSLAIATSRGVIVGATGFVGLAASGAAAVALKVAGGAAGGIFESLTSSDRAPTKEFAYATAVEALKGAAAAVIPNLTAATVGSAHKKGGGKTVQQLIDSFDAFLMPTARNGEYTPFVSRERGVKSFIRAHETEQRRQQAQDRVNQVAEGAIEN